MTLDEKMLAQARTVRDRLIKAQYEADRTEVAYQHWIRHLHAAGGSTREIAKALELSHQRVHQIVDAAGGKGALKKRTTKPLRGDLRCSFCSKAQADVVKLIAGPGVYICDACVDEAFDVITKRRAGDGGIPRERDTRLKCSFCGKTGKQVEDLVSGPGVYICNECLALCREIIEEEAKA